MKTMAEEGEDGIAIAKPWMETSIDFAKVKKMISKTVAIFSDNDPFVPLTNQEIFKQNLDAEIIIEHAKGHFTEEDGVKDLFVILSKI